MESLKQLLDDVSTKFPRAAWMNVAAGLCCGFVIGVPPMLIHFQSLLADCRNAKTLDECGNISPNICHWWTDPTLNKKAEQQQNSAACIGNIVLCEPKWNQQKCLEAPLCSFNAARNQCEQSRGWGWSNGEMGFFASAAVFGAVLGSLIASAAAKHEQPKRLNQFGMFVCVGALISWFSWIVSSHGYLFSAIGFICAGVGFGGNMALAPTVVSSVVSPSVRALAGTMMQFSITIGIAISALLALMFSGISAGFAPHVLYLAVAVSGGVSYYVADAICKPIVSEHFLQTSSGFAGGGGGGGGSSADGEATGGGGAGATMSVVPEDFVLEEESQIRREMPPMPVESGPPGLALGGGADSGGGAGRGGSSSSIDGSSDVAVVDMGGAPAATAGMGRTASSSASTSAVMMPLNIRNKNILNTCYLAGFLLATSLQVTGVNAIMSYAPKITAAAGIESPLVGNFVIMLWNAIACLPAIPLSAKYPQATLYLGGLAGATACCFLTALAMLVQSTSLAFICVCVFLLFFESGQGPMYFSLMTELFPPEFRNVAVGRINLANFGWNIVVAFSYPALCEALMPSGADLPGGVRRVFVLFGVLGMICFAALYVLFPKTYLKTKSDTPPQTGMTPEED